MGQSWHALSFIAFISIWKLKILRAFYIYRWWSRGVSGIGITLWWFWCGPQANPPKENMFLWLFQDGKRWIFFIYTFQNNKNQIKINEISQILPLRTPIRGRAPEMGPSLLLEKSWNLIRRESKGDTCINHQSQSAVGPRNQRSGWNFTKKAVRCQTYQMF